MSCATISHVQDAGVLDTGGLYVVKYILPWSDSFAIF